MKEFKCWIVKLLKCKLPLQLSLIYKMEMNKFQEGNKTLIGDHLVEQLDIMEEIEY